MDNALIELKNNEEIYKSTLMENLVRIAKTISVFDQMNLSSSIKNDMNHVQGAYQDEFSDLYVKGFIMRINEVRQKIATYTDDVIDKNSYCDAIDLLIHQEELNRQEEEGENEKFRDVYTIISLYTTFVIDEPIHPVGSPFPGHQQVEYINGIYYCPVKKNNEDNPRAVCKFCVAEQTIDS